MKMLKSKKGFKTIITIVAILFIAIAFVFFSYLFKFIGKNSPETSTQFKSIDTEYDLRTFLSSPSGIEPEELEVAVGDHMSNAQVAARTCNKEDSREYEALRQNAENYFKRLYGDGNWKLEIIYVKNIPNNTAEITGESIGALDIDSALRIYSQYKNLMDSAGKSDLSRKKVLYALNIRGSRIGMQLLPCTNEDSVVKLVLATNEGEPDVSIIPTIGAT